MTIGLASKEFRNKDIAFNANQILQTMEQAKQLGCDLVCFGEAFLQGFDAYVWDYATDKELALDRSSEVISLISYMSYMIGIDVAFGYLEKAADKLYSSYLVLAKGELVSNYRRISRGWKDDRLSDEHYQAGALVEPFGYRDKRVVVALCGDLWDRPDDFLQEQDLTLWPVYVDYSLEDWAKERRPYAQQTAHLPGDVLLINSINHPTGMGGAYHYRNGQIYSELTPGNDGLLIVTL